MIFGIIYFYENLNRHIEVFLISPINKIVLLISNLTTFIFRCPFFSFYLLYFKIFIVL